MEIGDFFEREFVVSDEKVREFAKVSGDFNPIHLDDEAAKESKFGRRIAHGMLTAAFLSALLAQDFPGPGATFLKQTMKFVRPVYIDDKILIRVELTDYRKSRGILTLSYQVTRVAGSELTVEGEILAMMS